MRNNVAFTVHYEKTLRRDENMNIKVTIRETTRLNLCISCNICEVICPTQAIESQEENGNYPPHIDQDKCVYCGKCYEVCPGKDIFWRKTKEDFSKSMFGDYLDIWCAQAVDREVLKNSASGGVVTSLVMHLLKEGEYESAFLLSGYNYEHQLETLRFTSKDDFSKTMKSRYLTVSHKNAVRHLVDNPKEKMIIVGTGCAVQGVLNVLASKEITRENLLIIGLFCDKTMNYNVYKYFSGHPACDDKLMDLYFRTKEAGGWPGNVRLCKKDGSYVDLINKERMRVKDYFQPERCLYCLDKLNRNADISVGDNYIPSRKDVLGVSSCVIRTKKGKIAFDVGWNLFKIKKDTEKALVESTKLEDKKVNVKYCSIKGIGGFEKYKATKKEGRQYKEALRKIRIGYSQPTYKKVNNAINRRERVIKVKRRLRNRIMRMVKITEV